MKKIKDVFNIQLLQELLNTAIFELKSNRLLYIDDETAKYIVTTIVSSGEGQYAFKSFCAVFGLKYHREWYDEDYSYFDKITKNLSKLLKIPEEYHLYIGWNENDGAIELYVEEN